MNRLAIPTQSETDTTAQSNFHESFDVATLARRPQSTASRIAHAVFAPMHYEAGYAYPLVVWLHDSRGNERQIRQVMPLVSMRNYVAVAPRGPAPMKNRPNRYGWRQTSDDVEDAESRVFECISVVRQRFNIHADRIFIAGHGSGGTMALRVAWNHPRFFAGAATIGGALPTSMCPLRRVNEMRRIPCLVATSRQSHKYPERQVCQDLRLLHTAGCTVALRQYPGGDELTTNMLSDLDRWLMDLVCAAKG